MEALSNRKQTVLDTIDEQIRELEKKLERVQPLMDELNVLRQTRRVLLSERSTTSGGGRGGNILTMEMMVHYLSENGPSKPGPIADHFGIPAGTIRAHLSRYRDERYERDEDTGLWSLIGNTEGEDEE